MFAFLLEQLRQQGFEVGVDQHVKVANLLHQVDGRLQPDDLKTHLCPLFAKNRDQQARFYAAFDQLYPFVQASAAPEEDAKTETLITPVRLADNKTSKLKMLLLFLWEQRVVLYLNVYQQIALEKS